MPPQAATSCGRPEVRFLRIYTSANKCSEVVCRTPSESGFAECLLVLRAACRPSRSVEGRGGGGREGPRARESASCPGAVLRLHPGPASRPDPLRRRDRHRGPSHGRETGHRGEAPWVDPCGVGVGRGRGAPEFNIAEGIGAAFARPLQVHLVPSRGTSAARRVPRPRGGTAGPDAHRRPYPQGRR